MMTSHMKPYITSEQRPDGGRYLPLQLQRAQLRKLAALLRGRRLLACKFPKMQTARSAWQVILIFDPDMSLELTSFSTGFSDRRRRGAVPDTPAGYIKYESAGKQGVDPYSGKTQSTSKSYFPIK